MSQVPDHPGNGYITGCKIFIWSMLRYCLKMSPIKQTQDQHGVTEVPASPPPPQPVDRIAPDASSLSSSSSSKRVCRICLMDGEEEQPLISPCACHGSMRYVHQFCLRKWTETHNIISCEICRYKYHVQNKLNPIKKWKLPAMSFIDVLLVIVFVLRNLLIMAITVIVTQTFISNFSTNLQEGLCAAIPNLLLGMMTVFSLLIVYVLAQTLCWQREINIFLEANSESVIQNAPEKYSLKK